MTKRKSVTKKVGRAEIEKALGAEFIASRTEEIQDTEVEKIEKIEEIEKVEEEKVEKIEERKVEKERVKTKRVKKFFATYRGSRKSITLASRIGKVVRGVPFEITEDDANSLVGSNFVVEVRYEHVKI